jgi:hypothetical protein
MVVPLAAQMTNGRKEPVGGGSGTDSANCSEQAHLGPHIDPDTQADARQRQNADLRPESKKSFFFLLFI